MSVKVTRAGVVVANLVAFESIAYDRFCPFYVVEDTLPPSSDPSIAARERGQYGVQKLTRRWCYE